MAVSNESHTKNWKAVQREPHRINKKEIRDPMIRGPMIRGPMIRGPMIRRSVHKSSTILCLVCARDSETRSKRVARLGTARAARTLDNPTTSFTAVSWSRIQRAQLRKTGSTAKGFVIHQENAIAVA